MLSMPNAAGTGRPIIYKGGGIFTRNWYHHHEHQQQFHLVPPNSRVIDN